MDYNWGSRLDFEEYYVERQHKAFPSHETTIQLNIRDDQALLIKKMVWAPVIPDLWVIIRDQRASGGSIQMTPPIKLRNVDHIRVQSPTGPVRTKTEPNPHLPMNIRIWGTLFTFKGPPVADKELVGISLLDQNTRATNILDEEACFLIPKPARKL